MVTLMKKINYIGTIATICISIIGCIQENEINNLDDRFVIYASREDLQSTKTELQSDNSIVWTKGDEISLFVDSGTNGGYRFVSTNEANASSTTFISSDNIEMNGSSTYWAVYPYSESTNCYGSYLKVVLPSEQVAKEGTFDEDLFISVAKSNTNSMTFKNICGGIKFSVANEGITEVVFKNNDGSMISGTLKIKFNDDGLPELSSWSGITGGRDEIRVKAPNNGTFKVGQYYYAVIPPVRFSKGITVKYLSSSFQTGERIIDSHSDIVRSTFTRLTEQDKGLEFKERNISFKSKGNSSLALSGEGYTDKTYVEYSLDGITWNKYIAGTTLEFSTESPLFLRGINDTFKNIRFTMDGDLIECSGNLMYLLNYQQELNYVPESCFSSLFCNCDKLLTAPDLPATELSNSCYYSMFRGCKSLTQAPKLPATLLADRCYCCMFEGCDSLAQAPELPAIRLETFCYAGMFENCSSLVQAPDLPATELSDYCYYDMFKGCTSLTQAPKHLPAQRLAEYCYSEMFMECTSLTKAPDLSAEYYAEYCCKDMFRECTSLVEPPQFISAIILKEESCSGMFCWCKSLTKAPDFPNLKSAGRLSCCCMFSQCISLQSAPAELKATELFEYCYWSMFEGCVSLTQAPELPATKLAPHCYSEMFRACSSLIKAPEVLPAKSLPKYCYQYMFGSCCSLSEAPKLNFIDTGGASCEGMFSYCTSLVKAPELCAHRVYGNCYNSMFEGCTSLTEAPELPATEIIGENCYYNMFSGCTSLTQIPSILPATQLKTGCYKNMFKDCKSLTSAPELPATELADDCYFGMFSGCTSLTKAPELPATDLPSRCYSNMFTGCSNLNYVKALYIRRKQHCLSQFDSWLVGVAPVGTFVQNKYSQLTADGIPDGWTIEYATE